MQSLASYPTPPSDGSDHARESIAAKIERLSAAIVAALNARDFGFTSKEAQEVVAHLTPSWKAHLDTYAQDSKPRSFSDQCEVWRKRADEYPDVHFEIEHMSSHVDEAKGYASVYMSLAVTGLGGVVLQGMNELKWRRQSGTWLCYYVVGLRGSPGNMGGFD